MKEMTCKEIVAAIRGLNADASMVVTFVKSGTFDFYEVCFSEQRVSSMAEFELTVSTIAEWEDMDQKVGCFLDESNPKKPVVKLSPSYYRAGKNFVSNVSAKEVVLIAGNL